MFSNLAEDAAAFPPREEAGLRPTTDGGLGGALLRRIRPDKLPAASSFLFHRHG